MYIPTLQLSISPVIRYSIFHVLQTSTSILNSIPERNTKQLAVPSLRIYMTHIKLLIFRSTTPISFLLVPYFCVSVPFPVYLVFPPSSVPQICLMMVTFFSTICCKEKLCYRNFDVLISISVTLSEIVRSNIIATSKKCYF